MWITLTLFAAIGLALSRLTQKKLLKGGFDPIAYIIFFQITVAFLTLPIALLDNFTIPPLSEIWLGLIMSTFLYAGANITSYLALKNIPVSEFVIISATIPIWTALSSIPFLRESASPLKLIGILLTTIGIATAFHVKNKLKFGRWHALALVSAIFFGFAYTNDGFLLLHFKATTYTTISFFLPAILLTTIYIKKLKPIRSFVNRKTIIMFLVSCILFALSSFSIYQSYRLGGEISKIAAVLQTNVILTVLLGIFFLKERENIIRKLTGVVIVIAGIIMVQGGFRL